ncbi:MAG TPA: hypothetical protein VFL89_02610 [Solirubrobacterales bacterium]|nr:hypothetical protein [Solirubrobacterales bacterium]
MRRKLLIAFSAVLLLLVVLLTAASASVTNTRITSGPSGAIGTDSATFTFTSPERGGFECRFDSRNRADWASCDSPKTYSELAEGSHTFEVRALNKAGHPDPTPSAASFFVEAEPPDTAIASAPSETIAARQASFAFEATQAGTFECSLDSAAWSVCLSPQVYDSLSDGPHTFEVRAVNELGQADPTPAVVDFAVSIPAVPVAKAAVLAPSGPSGPVAGETFNLALVDGTVDLICPGESEISRLKDFKQIPMGCLINTRKGTVDLTASKGSSGEKQSAHFWGGVFIATQPPGDDQKVELKLAGKRMCERRGGSKGSATISRAKRGGGRKLWGSGKGNYKTSGSYGSATVRGTTWLVVDRCDASTLFKVSEGTVWVRDFIKGRLIVLEAGDRYIAKAAIPRLGPNLWK